MLSQPQTWERQKQTRIASSLLLFESLPKQRHPRYSPTLPQAYPPSWLAPALQHRVDTTLAGVRRLQRWAPVAALSTELVHFDLQQLQNLEISGVEYQQGTLAGYEGREYLFEKWGRKCVYCGAEHVPFNLDHLQSKARGRLAAILTKPNGRRKTPRRSISPAER